MSMDWAALIVGLIAAPPAYLSLRRTHQKLDQVAEVIDTGNGRSLGVTVHDLSVQVDEIDRKADKAATEAAKAAKVGRETAVLLTDHLADADRNLNLVQDEITALSRSRAPARTSTPRKATRTAAPRTPPSK